MGWVITSLLVVIFAVSIFFVLPTPPAPPTDNGYSRLHGTPLDIPGPIVSASIEKMNLDGLTVIPL